MATGRTQNGYSEALVVVLGIQSMDSEKVSKATPTHTHWEVWAIF